MPKREPVRVKASAKSMMRDAVVGSDKQWYPIVEFAEGSLFPDSWHDTEADAIQAAHNWVKSLAEREVICDD